jgi:hypothetical protein
MCRFAVILLAVFLAACQSAAPDPSSPFYMPPAGSKLILNQGFVIPPHELKIFVQDGRLAYGANEYYPFCKFELRDLKDTPQEVRPDEFTIDSVSRQTGVFAAFDQFDKRSLLAGIGVIGGYGGISIGIGGTGISIFDGKPSPVVYGIRMDLSSSRQPNVFRMTCGHLQDPDMGAHYLSIDEIRQALGGVFTLRLPQEAIKPAQPLSSQPVKPRG